MQFRSSTTEIESLQRDARGGYKLSNRIRGLVASPLPFRARDQTQRRATTTRLSPLHLYATRERDKSRGEATERPNGPTAVCLPSPQCTTFRLRLLLLLLLLFCPPPLILIIRSRVTRQLTAAPRIREFVRFRFYTLRCFIIGY